MTGWLMSCPFLFSSARSFRRLSDVHNCRRIGSPRVTGSSNDLRSESKVGSSVILDLRPPPSAHPAISNWILTFEIFKPSIYRPSRQTRRLSDGAHAAVSNCACFGRRPASSAPLIKERSHRLPTFPKNSDGRSAYHAAILPPPILPRESPSYNFCVA